MSTSPPTPSTPPETAEVADLLTVIRVRAQATRRRIGRVLRLDRHHIAADLATIEAAVDVLTLRLLGEPPVDPSAEARATDD